MQAKVRSPGSKIYEANTVFRQKILAFTRPIIAKVTAQKNAKKDYKTLAPPTQYNAPFGGLTSVSAGQSKGRTSPLPSKIPVESPATRDALSRPYRQTNKLPQKVIILSEGRSPACGTGHGTRRTSEPQARTAYLLERSGIAPCSHQKLLRQLRGRQHCTSSQALRAI